MLNSGEATYTTARELRGELQKRDFSVLKSTNKTRSRVLYVRSQRGLLSYEGLPLRELKLFAAQRGWPVDGKATAADLKARLEQADDESTFDRFLDLPPELRRIVFSHYFRSLDDRSNHPTDDYYAIQRHISLLFKSQPPPIASACTQIRRESLPLFYECCEFSISTSPSSLKSFTSRLDRASKAFLKSTSAYNFARIRVLHCAFRDFSMCFSLDLNNRMDPIRMAFPDNFHWPPDLVVMQRQDHLSSKLREVAVGIAAREGPLKLQKSDLTQMYEIARAH